MAETTFRHGSPIMIDYTPASGNIAAGDVVELVNAASNTIEIGLSLGIAHVDIVNGVKGALAVGLGVYDVVNLNNAATYATVYWDGSKVTTVSTNNSQFGFIVDAGGGGANSTARALHIGWRTSTLVG